MVSVEDETAEPLDLLPEIWLAREFWIDEEARDVKVLSVAVVEALARIRFDATPPAAVPAEVEIQI